MLRVSKITDYGIVILSHLAGQPAGSTHNARELATGAHLPLPVVSKTLKILARQGLVASQRGSKGGYALARPAREISLAQAIAALEGPIGLIECSVHEGQCAQEPTCVVRAPWQRINRAVSGALEGISIADLVRGPDGEGELIQMQVASAR